MIFCKIFKFDATNYSSHINFIWFKPRLCLSLYLSIGSHVWGSRVLQIDIVVYKSITTFWNMLLFNSRSMFLIGHQFPQKIFRFPFYFGILHCRPFFQHLMHELRAGSDSSLLFCRCGFYSFLVLIFCCRILRWENGLASFCQIINLGFVLNL